MGSFVTTSLILIAVAVGLVLLVRRNLKQRELARKFRAIFIATANDLVGKHDFPDAHAKQLVAMASIPQGWLTRFIVFVTFRDMIWGRSGTRKPNNAPKLEQVPPNLRALYITAIFSLLISDSFRCALFGRVVRSTHRWLFDAVAEVKPDVNAHATKEVVEQIGQVRLPQRFVPEPALACVA